MLLGIIILLLLLAVIVLVTFVSPNRFKPVLTDQVQKFTGRELIVDGDLSWSFFPYLGVTAGHMSLGNPSDFKQKTFAEFSSATVGVKLMPLFSGRVESSGIALHGMKLTLIKKADGKANWVFQKTVTANEATNAPASRTNYAAGSLGVAVSSVDITDADVTWIDEQSKQTISIQHFNFHAKKINFTKPVPVSMDLDFSVKNPVLTGHATLTSDVAFNLDKQIYSLRDVDFVVQTTKGDKKINAHVTGDLVADLAEQTLQWTNFKANVADLNLTGKLNVQQLTSAPQATGHFDIKPFDLKALLKDLGQDNEKLQVAKDVDGSVDFSASAKAIKVTGLIKIDEVQAAKVKLTKVNANVNFQDGTLNLSPVTANLYEGNLIAQSKVNLNTPAPEIALQGNLTNIQAGPLLQDLGGPNQKFKLTGAANVALKVTTVGTDGATIVKNLNGTSKINLTNGTIEGADLGYYVDAASELVSKQSVSSTNTNKTTFGNLSATAVIQNGVITNNDLLLDSPRFDTKGKGTINLVAKNIDYSLQTSVKQTQINTVKSFAGVMIPILIKGDLESPSVRLDTSLLLKTVAQQQMEKHKDQIQQKIQEKIQEKLPGEAGALLKNLLGN